MSSRGRGRGDRGGRGHNNGGPPNRERSDTDRSTGSGGGERGGFRAGRGRPRVDRRQMELEKFDLVPTRGAVQDKKGSTGAPMQFLSNYFTLDKRTDWGIFHYRVDFAPADIETREKKQLFRNHKDKFGGNYIFDGSSLYVSNRISPDPLVVCSVRDSDKSKVEMTIHLVATLTPTDVMYLQVFNILMRKCLEFMELEELGRHFYDRHKAIVINAHRLELWPGYKTSIRNHEYDILLGVELTHKVIRRDTCLHVMDSLIAARGDFRENVKRELIGCIVMTHYNRKTYRVDDIDWDMTPKSTFDYADKGKTSYFDYFKQKYGMTCTVLGQPMLISRPKKKDFHRGQTGPISLVPEFCQMTGLTDAMRSNFQLMKCLTGYLHVSPQTRVEQVKGFMTRLRAAPGVEKELQNWGLKFNEKLVPVKGRTLEKQKILFGPTTMDLAKAKFDLPNNSSDWDQSFRNKEMFSTVALDNWVIIVPQRDASSVEILVSNLQRVGNPLKFRLSRPLEVLRINDIRVPSYMAAIDQAMSNYGRRIQMIFVILAKQEVDVYSAVKKKCTIDYGVLSQCLVIKNITHQTRALSIATKVVVQLNAKLGGEPWVVQVPLAKLMIVGFDVYHCARGRGASIGALVATTNANQTKYYSTTSSHNTREELSSNLCADFTKCLYAYAQVNNELPSRIIIYRDGVGEGQLNYIFSTEMRQIQDSIKTIYADGGRPMPKFSFVIVTKRINTRIFALNQPGNRIENPNPGSIVDDVITLPERFDFYLISQYSRQGTVSPTSYNILHDEQGLNADKLQQLTYKLCHVYFNWSGTISVPAPCQYAHKLAYLTGMALQGAKSGEQLSHVLHFL
ncbi:piwi-like protein Siwi isoform X2 [Folsomia candida]|nr:piwi-like protein Siwi isoform X2 [Folsomia candida]